MVAANQRDTREIILLTIKRKKYRSILNTCKTPARLGVIFADIPGKKYSFIGLMYILKKLINAGLLENKHDTWGGKYVTTEKGLRLLSRYPAPKNTPMQYITGFDIPKR